MKGTTTKGVRLIPEPQEFTGKSGSDEISFQFENYRVMLRDGRYSIYRNYYDKNGSIVLWDNDPETPLAETVEDLRRMLEDMLGALGRPVLDYYRAEVARGIYDGAGTLNPK